MANLLYLVHRMPYPPDKGDKVRSYHLLRHLQQQHRVFLGTFIDDPADEVHLPALRALCPDLHVARIAPRWRKLASARALLTGEAQSIAYYRDAGLRRWVHEIAASHELLASVVFSSTMAPYAHDLLPQVPMLVDLVDVDSAKWTQYAEARPWPLSWVYRREGQRLLAHERDMALAARRSFLVTQQEVELFASLAPECRERVEAAGNGVDAERFRPDASLVTPFGAEERAIVFTGAMDYWPNVDAVQWFATEVLPRVREREPRASFWIVGRNPTAAVQALAGPAVHVTGTVAQVEPYLQHAAAVVAPLRVARGIQNKILEAMAMGQPVVTVPSCAQPIGAGAEQGLRCADDAAGFADTVLQWLADPAARQQQGLRAREHVVRHFSWEANLDRLQAWLPASLERA